MPSDHVPHPSPDNRSTEVLYLRVPTELLERVDAHLESMRGDAPPGVEVTRAAAIRNLLELGLKSTATAAERAA